MRWRSTAKRQKAVNSSVGFSGCRNEKSAGSWQKTGDERALTRRNLLVGKNEFMDAEAVLLLVQRLKVELSFDGEGV